MCETGMYMRRGPTPDIPATRCFACSVPSAFGGLLLWHAPGQSGSLCGQAAGTALTAAQDTWLLTPRQATCPCLLISSRSASACSADGHQTIGDGSASDVILRVRQEQTPLDTPKFEWMKCS